MGEVLSHIPESWISDQGDTLKSIGGRLVRCASLEGLELDVALGLLSRYPDQPRTKFTPSQLSELQRDLERHGQKEPIIATPFQSADGPVRLLVVNGERRLRALTASTSLPTARAVCRGYLNEPDLFRAAMTSHKESQTLTVLERDLMTARLYEVEKQRNPELAVAEFAAQEKINYNTVHDARRIAGLDSILLDWARQGVLARSNLLYLYHRENELGKAYPKEELYALVRAHAEAHPGRSISLKSLQDMFREALEKGGSEVDARRRRIGEQAALVVTAMKRVATEFDALTELCDDVETDPALRDYILGQYGIDPVQLSSLSFAAQIFEGHHVDARKKAATGK